MKTNALPAVSHSLHSRYKKGLHKIGRFFFHIWIWVRHYGSLYMHVQLLQHKSFEHVEEHLYGYIRLYQIIGYRIQVERLQEQSTGDCLGYLMFYRGGILERRTMLKLITKHSEANHASACYAHP